MTPEEKIMRALNGISPTARAWSDSRYMAALIEGATEMEGPELIEYIRLLVQLSYDQGAESGK